VVSRHKKMLRMQLDQAASQATTALAMLRGEVRTLRLRGQVCGAAQARRRGALSLARALAAWSGWSRAVQAQPSGQPPQQKQQQQQEDESAARAQDEAASARRAALAAARSEARAAALARRHEAAARRGEHHAALLATLKAWEKAVAASKAEAALRQARAEAKTLEATVATRVRGESRTALHKAWNEQAEVARKATALERRVATADPYAPRPEELAEVMTEVLRTNLATSGGLRPSTALAIEAQLQAAEAQATDRIKTARRTATASRGFSAEEASTAVPFTLPRLVGGAEVLRLSEEEEEAALPARRTPTSASSRRPPQERRARARGQLADALARFASRQEAAERAEVLALWHRAALAGQLARARRQAQEAKDKARDACVSRKGLFTAALGQQARYWMSDAFVQWRQVTMERLLSHAREG